MLCTAILEAGRRSLDAEGRAICIDYNTKGVVSGLTQLQNRRPGLRTETAGRSLRERDLGR